MLSYLPSSLTFYKFICFLIANYYNSATFLSRGSSVLYPFGWTSSICLSKSITFFHPSLSPEKLLWMDWISGFPCSLVWWDPVDGDISKRWDGGKTMGLGVFIPHLTPCLICGVGWGPPLRDAALVTCPFPHNYSHQVLTCLISYYSPHTF